LPGSAAGATVFKSGLEGYACYRIPALVSAGGGRLLAFAEGRRYSCSDHDWNDIVMKRSEDGGQTWGNLSVVVTESTPSDHITDGNPAPVLLRNGTLLLPYSRNNKEVFVVSSHDVGASWTAPQNITRAAVGAGWTWVATGPPGSVELPSGDIVVPCDHIESGGATGSHTLRWSSSSNEWQLQQLLTAGNECQAALLGNGSMLLGMRPRSRATGRLFAMSDNGGATFGPARSEPSLRDPECQGSLVSGGSPQTVYQSNADSSESRANVTVHVSRDGGGTWAVLAAPYDGPSAYSSLAVTSSSESSKSTSLGLLWEAWPQGAPSYAQIAFVTLEDDMA